MQDPIFNVHQLTNRSDVQRSSTHKCIRNSTCINSQTKTEIQRSPTNRRIQCSMFINLPKDPISSELVFVLGSLAASALPSHDWSHTYSERQKEQAQRKWNTESTSSVASALPSYDQSHIIRRRESAHSERQKAQAPLLQHCNHTIRRTCSYHT